MDSEETTAYSSDATIHAFSLETIHGVDYKFEIDQLNNLIYNLDSMPVDADTLIDSIQIDQISVAWTVTSADTVLNTEAYHNLLPAMNATGSEGIKLKVYAPDGVTTRDYTLQIRVHRQDPDSLMWTRMDREGDPISQTINQEGQKVVILNDELLLYTSTSELYRTSTAPGQYGWSRQSVTGLPEEADITTLDMVSGPESYSGGSVDYSSDPDDNYVWGDTGGDYTEPDTGYEEPSGGYEEPSGGGSETGGGETTGGGTTGGETTGGDTGGSTTDPGTGGGETGGGTTDPGTGGGETGGGDVPVDPEA